MPLTRGQIIGYDDQRLAFKFTMLNAGETIDCQISDAAMDELIGTKGSPHTVREAEFLTHRETIERLASDLFDGAGALRGLSSSHLHEAYSEIAKCRPALGGLSSGPFL
jgi:hypothetical protein